MFYDLNVPWSADDQHLPRTLAFLHELGYNVVALNHSITGQLPKHLTCPIPNPLPASDVPSKLTVLRRVTLTLTETLPGTRLAALAQEYDILALRPIDERTLQLACSSLDCDIISLDLTQRFGFFFKHKMLGEALRSGKRIEINYSQGLLGDAQARRNVIGNATQLISKSRGRGVILCSETKAGAIGCRGPWDAINLAAVWGLSRERGHEGMSKEARSVIVSAKLKRTGYRGVIDVVYGGEKPPPVVKETAPNDKGKQKNGQKRKADAISSEGNATPGGGEKLLSNRQRKKLAHQARLAASGSDPSQAKSSGAQATSEKPNTDGDT
ncbi:hypothetical protein AC578_10149 [Pseudocercospora eumusae]|uniref:RNase P subunit p30 n=1 Tax=Pseudocercospora eumusae TaxID=321146 RepID=A0A139HYT5_9PEZI|nr:hypothetical protein AC578_10149 [Pseudocercospora eumusae]